MLIEFSVTNYRSFLTTQSLTLAANTFCDPLSFMALTQPAKVILYRLLVL